MSVFPVLVGLTGAVIFVVLFYIFYWKPRIDLPLPNERLVGYVTMWLPRGFGLITGPMTTARMTMQRYWTTLVQNEKDDDKRKLWESNRDFILQFQLFAIKNGGEKKILLFDVNPEDQRFLDVDKENKGFLLHGVQDVISVGEYNGFEYLGVKLNDAVTAFTDKEGKRFEAALKNVKFVQDAARNVERISSLKEENDSISRELTLERKAKAKMRTERDFAKSALGQKTFTEDEAVKLRGGVRETLKQWFTWWQLLSAGFAYFAAPHILVWTNTKLNEPELTYVVLLITAAGFFAVPLAKKIFGRWL